MAQPPRPGTSVRRPDTPRWVKGFGVVIVITILVAVIVMVASGGQHGPGMHTGIGGQTAQPSRSAELTAVGGPASATHAARTIAITTDDSMIFAPASVNVASG